MKTFLKSSLSVIFLTFIFFIASAQKPDLKTISENIVNKTVQVKPGDLVVISGNTHYLDLMEELAISVNQASGLSSIFISSDKVLWDKWHNNPVEFLKYRNTPSRNTILNSTIYISLPSCYDCKSVYSDLPKEKSSLINRTPEETQLWDKSKVRQYFIQYPDDKNAQKFGMSAENYNEMIWKAIGEDYKQIADRCTKLESALKNGKLLKITCPAGTNFSVRLDGVFFTAKDGFISEDEAKADKLITRYTPLPAGRFAFFPNITTGSGTIVSVKDLDAQENQLTMVKGTVKNGELTGMSSEKGADFVKNLYIGMTGTYKILGEILIGVNPDLKAGENAQDFFWETEGLVMVGFGNTAVGGNRTDANGGWYFPVFNATVTIDGQEIIKNGKLLAK